MDVERKLRILHALKEIEEAKDSETAVHAFADYVRFYGFDSVGISQFANPARVPLNQRIAIVTWPEEYLQRRTPDDEMRDPIVAYALKSRTPFFWQTAYEYADRYGKSLMDKARDHNMSDGIVFPIHSADSLPGGVSLSGNTQNIGEEDKQELYLAAIHVYAKLEKLTGPFPFAFEVKLSRREKDVLQWAAAGKTMWEVSEILSLAEKTVEHYMATARKKLGAVNTTHAVSTAISRELILP